MTGLLMIGVIAHDSEKEIAREFFQLFKTPWEFFTEDKDYDVLLSTTGHCPDAHTRLALIYQSAPLSFDRENGIIVQPTPDNPSLEYQDETIPIYGRLAAFSKTNGKSLLKIKKSRLPAAVAFDTGTRSFVRIGYDLFQEVFHLLVTGQPAGNAAFPTLENHILLIRHMMQRAGINFVEIPPIPAGYRYTACLTHDVDFAGIRHHIFDRTFFGFLYRALPVSCFRALVNPSSRKNCLENLKAVFSLPLVFLGIKKDFFNQFESYIHLEKPYGATFFLIPQKNKNGAAPPGKNATHRATRYDITDIRNEVEQLQKNGFEIGLHGLDAWQGFPDALDEKIRIETVTQTPITGSRMHWLFFSQETPAALKKAGFIYDSTRGYNNAVGFKTGTTQIHRIPGAANLLELPMNIQDTALFSSKRMNLDEAQAAAYIAPLLKAYNTHGGVLTINWHQRSPGPERLWKAPYLSLIKRIRQDGAWITNAGKAVDWFQMRRRIVFDNVEIRKNGIKVDLKSDGPIRKPGLILRCHYALPPRKPGNGRTHTSSFDMVIQNRQHLDFFIPSPEARN